MACKAQSPHEKCEHQKNSLKATVFTLLGPDVAASVTLYVEEINFMLYQKRREWRR